MQPGVTDILLESMTGSPKNILRFVPQEVTFSVVLDVSSFTVHQKELLELSQRNNTRILVRVNQNGSHHAKTLAVRTKAEEGTIRDMVELGNANLTSTSAQHLNSTSRVVVESLSPIKKRHAQLATEKGFVLVSPTGKRVFAALPQSHKKHKTYQKDNSPVIVNKTIMASLDTAQDTLTIVPTSPTDVEVRRKLF